MIGIIPAGGEATRMGGIPKMLLPIPGGALIGVLIERMKLADPQIFITVIGNEQNHAFLKAHDDRNVVTLAFHEPTMSAAVIHVHQIEEDCMLFGMPDTYFDDAQVFIKLAAAVGDGADVAVGICRTRQKQRNKLGMVDFTAGLHPRLTTVIDKPETTTLIWAWGVLAWKPIFWNFMKAEDPHVGYALPRAIEAGLDVRPVLMCGEYFDCGTPDEYFECIDHLRRTSV